jgi:hypothetical protein
VTTKDQLSIELNTDFSTKGLSAQEITVVAAWQSGAISQETMHELFRRGDNADNRIMPYRASMSAVLLGGGF